MHVAVAVDQDGTIAGGWGRAHWVAIADVIDGEVVSWEPHEVAWDVAHDEGSEGSHHARIARFLREHEVGAVVAGHMGDGMVRMLGTMGIPTLTGVAGDGRSAAVVAAR